MLGVLVPVVTVMIAAASRLTPLFLYLWALVPRGSWGSFARMRREGRGSQARIRYEDLPRDTPDLGNPGDQLGMPSSALP